MESTDFEDIQHVFLVGAKNFGFYGGYETFVDKLTYYHQQHTGIKYHMFCKKNGLGDVKDEFLKKTKRLGEDHFEYHNADCRLIKVPEHIGPAQAIYYDCKALEESIRIIKEDGIEHPIVYVMACRVGLLIRKYYYQIHSLGGKLFVNPDGHEWLRAKWSYPVKKYWKWSEKTMIKYCDLAICDSVHIERYIHDSYDGCGIRKTNPVTTYISYGAEIRKSKLSNDDHMFASWKKEHKVRDKEYYLIVGRFVPENNYETMIREFMKSRSNRDLVIITNANAPLYKKLSSELGVSKDKRIKFVGTVYDQELLMKIRENAYAYLHGHEVGGTNPSLLEALGSTELNLLLDVCFNREVAENSALYWTKMENSLSELIDYADRMSPESIAALGCAAKERMGGAYNWDFIAGRYEEVFLENERSK